MKNGELARFGARVVDPRVVCLELEHDCEDLRAVIHHEVAQGGTLASIARQSGVSRAVIGRLLELHVPNYALDPLMAWARGRPHIPVDAAHVALTRLVAAFPRAERVAARRELGATLAHAYSSRGRSVPDWLVHLIGPPT